LIFHAYAIIFITPISLPRHFDAISLIDADIITLRHYFSLFSLYAAIITLMPLFSSPLLR